MWPRRAHHDRRKGQQLAYGVRALLFNLLEGVRNEARTVSSQGLVPPYTIDISFHMAPAHPPAGNSFDFGLGEVVRVKVSMPLYGN
jgi:hypothetical protein